MKRLRHVAATAAVALLLTACGGPRDAIDLMRVGKRLVEADVFSAFQAFIEIAELRLPQRQRLRLGQSVAVLEAEHGFL